MVTYLDRLPVELLQTIFQYMTSCDIFWAFHSISPYVNTVVEDVRLGKLDFHSVSKQCFDLVCDHVNVERLLSLTLSEDTDTPGQIELFFSRFSLREMNHLRSLTFLFITNRDLSLILDDLPQLKCLHSLVATSRSSECLRLGQTLNLMGALRNLSLTYGDIFDHSVPTPLQHLQVLNAGYCHFLELRRLQVIVPSLVSLTIVLQANHQLQLLEYAHSWSLSLKRLHLKLVGKHPAGTQQCLNCVFQMRRRLLSKKCNAFFPIFIN